MAFLPRAAKLERHGAEVEHPLFSRNGELSDKSWFGMPRPQTFRTRKRAAGSRWDRQGEKPCPEVSTGAKRVYIHNCREAKKLIPAKEIDHEQKKDDE
jgi:hypothetical protein